MSAGNVISPIEVKAVASVPDEPCAGRPQYTIVMLFPGHMLTDYLAYGDGLVAFGFISALARRGHRLHVIAQRTAFKTPLPPNVTMYSTPATATSGIADRFAFLTRSRAIVRRLKRTQRIDLVHQLNPVCNGMSLGLIGLKIPIVLGTFVAKWPGEEDSDRTPFGRLFGLPAVAFRNAALRLQEHYAAAFLLATPAAASRFSSAARISSRAHLLPNGIDISEFTPFPGVRGSQHTILFLASVAEKKGIFTLLDAFDIVRGVILDAKLVIAGHGPHFERAEQRVARSPWKNDIEMRGQVSRAAVPQLMADSAVYCLPSTGEPYGMTVIEAMACAKPIVVTDSGAFRDLIDDAGGRRVQAGNAQELAAALIEVLLSRSLQKSMAAHNRATAEREYDWPRVIAKLESIYEAVVNRQVPERRL